MKVKIRRTICAAILRTLPEPVVWKVWLKVSALLPAIIALIVATFATPNAQAQSGTIPPPQISYTYTIPVNVYMPMIENNEVNAVIATYWEAVAEDGDCLNDWLTHMPADVAVEQRARCLLDTALIVTGQAGYHIYAPVVISSN